MKCKCFQNGTPCVNCLPLKRGLYKNARLDLVQAIPPRDPPDPQPSPHSSPFSQSHSLFSFCPGPLDVNSGHTPSMPSYSLPCPEEVTDANFTWGSLDGSTFCRLITDAYSKVVHWCKDFFRVPFGSSGKAFVNELAHLFRAFATCSTLESIALKSVNVACVLLLQCTHSRAKSSDSSNCLSHRLDLWHDGQISELLLEGRSIQQTIFNCPSY